MEGDNADYMFIVTSMEEDQPRPVERGLRSAVKGKSFKAVSVSALKENMERFFEQLKEILDSGKHRIGDFEVDQVEVSAQITAGGEVCLLGSGVKMEAQGGIKFVLRRLKH